MYKRTYFKNKINKFHVILLNIYYIYPIFELDNKIYKTPKKI